MKSDLKRVESIFADILSLPPEARGEALFKACGGDDALRAEVESLLEHDASTGTFLTGSIFGPEIALPRHIEPREEPQGAPVGAYSLIRRIGSGGMGTVYLGARADGQFEQQVAIKVVKRGMDSEEILRRFEMERRTLATLNHPHIARLYDGGATPDGRPYLAMEYVDGSRIDHYCDAKRLNITQRLRLFAVVCDAVRFAHQNLVVHRDLKPSNILVDRSGVPKLLDFGLAKVLVETGTIDPTISDERRLTPAYASPEQVAGKPLSTATDIYSLGVILYELLTGRRPYRVATGAPAEFERAVLEQQPVPPSAAVRRTDGFVQSTHAPASQLTVESLSEVREGDPDRLARRLRGDIDTIVLKALHKDPTRRYESVEQFVADIERHLDGLPVLARPDTALYRMDKFVRRHAVAVALSMATIVALCLGLGVAMWQREVALKARAAAEEQGEVARKERAIAEEQREVARHERTTAERQSEIAKQERDAAYLARDQAEATADFFQDILSSADPMNEGPKTTVKDVVDAAAIRVDSELRHQPRVQAAIRSTIGRIYLGLSLFEQAEMHIRAAHEARLKIFEPGHHDLAESEFDLARLLYEQGKFEQAETLLLQSLRAHEKLRGEDNVDTARVWNDLGAVRRASGKLDLAEQALTKALQIREKSMGRRSADVAETLNNLSGVFADRGDFKQAEVLLTEALSIRREVFHEEHPMVIQGMANIAVMAARQGDLGRAEALFREALALGRKVLGNEHTVVAQELSSLANVLILTDRSDEAEPLIREALKIRQLRLAPDDARVFRTQVSLASCLFELGKTEEAEALATGALARRRPHDRRKDGFWTNLIARLEKHYRVSGKTDEADQMRQILDELKSPTTQPAAVP